MSGFSAFPAPAKLNLFLQVVGRRADGYHLLQTVFQFIDYGDTLRLRVREDGRLTHEAPPPGVAPERELCLRAARALREAGGTRLGAEIRLEKRLPLGGGLGGGSSDAATTLIALNRLWGLDFPRARLMEIALGLGADVPVFVFGQNAFGEGIGERLTPLALPPAWYVVLIPPVAVATAEIFSDPGLTRNAEPVKMPGFSVGFGRNAPAFGRNALEPVVCRRHPEVARHLEWLRRHAPAALTGSGACVFAGFDDAAAAQAVLAQLPPGMRGFAAPGLAQHPLHGLLND